MRVLVCGGRHFSNYEAVEKYLDMLHAIYRFDVVIHGAACGADSLAAYWARRHHVDEWPFPADWKVLHRRAGIVRNAQMIREGRPDLVVSFPGGRGTGNMRKQARDAGITTLDLSFDPVRALITEQWKAVRRAA